MATWNERKQALKREVVDYLESRGCDRATIITACEFMKNLARIEVELAKEFRNWELWGDASFTKEEIEKHFGPVTRKAILEFTTSLISLEIEAAQHLEKQREEVNKCWARDDFEYEDYLDSLPKVEIILHPDRLVVNALEYVEGLKDRLPPGGRFLSRDRIWEYPLSARDSLLKLNYPIYKYPDCE